MANLWATLNHGGSDIDNPILENLKLRIKLHKGSAQTLRQAWVQVGNEVYLNLTDQAVETDSEVSIEVTAGVELQAGYPAVRNVIHFTTSQDGHSKQVIYVATRPSALITLDGYNCENPLQPFIWPLYSPAEGGS